MCVIQKTKELMAKDRAKRELQEVRKQNSQMQSMMKDLIPV